MTARPITEGERVEGLQRCLWFVINVAPKYADGAWAELEPLARALLSTSAAVRGMREALEKAEAIVVGHAESQEAIFRDLDDKTSKDALLFAAQGRAYRRIAKRIAALSGIETGDEQARPAASAPASNGKEGQV